MKVKLENREYEFKANGKFLKRYQEQFNEGVMMAIYKCVQEKDALICAKLIYCGIEETMTFDEWLDSFETPLFVLPEMDKVVEYLVRTTAPTVEPKGDGEESSKKKTTS